MSRYRPVRPSTPVEPASPAAGRCKAPCRYETAWGECCADAWAVLGGCLAAVRKDSPWSRPRGGGSGTSNRRTGTGNRRTGTWPASSVPVSACVRLRASVLELESLPAPFLLPVASSNLLVDLIPLPRSFSLRRPNWSRSASTPLFAPRSASTPLFAPRSASTPLLAPRPRPDAASWQVQPVVCLKSVPSVPTTARTDDSSLRRQLAPTTARFDDSSLRRQLAPTTAPSDDGSL
ncbi:hypothetical protein DCS_00053 [Drechmeria coniospora]|uniref:Uncharacterized protein n=1 Tax=Drechmeria coniospora TaxID=98403 RepID=A0A151GPA8_DRECN|nr:hypothetical protein DCS_00053 [Drechmeria coniospora]KYK58926.1 hypothetical protein DCS_00053 [Drechmeria coniospora]